MACGDAGTPKAVVGQAAPAFVLDPLDGGRAMSLASFQGRPVILTFFASWCLPCKRELPLFLAAQGRHPEIALVGIVFKDEPVPARLFHNGIGGGWPALLDPGGKVATAYSVNGIPRTYFIGKDGVLRDVRVGETDAADLERRVALITT